MLLVERLFFCLFWVLYLGVSLVIWLGTRLTEPREPWTAGTHVPDMGVLKGGVGAEARTVVSAPAFLDFILADLLAEWMALPIYEPERIEILFQNVGHWLAHVVDEDALNRWVHRFALAIQVKHPGLPFSVCVWVVEQRISVSRKG